MQPTLPCGVVQRLEPIPDSVWMKEHVAEHTGQRGYHGCEGCSHPSYMSKKIKFKIVNKENIETYMLQESASTTENHLLHGHYSKYLFRFS